MEITKDQLRTIIQNAPQGSDPKKIVKALIAKGHSIQGLVPSYTSMAKGIVTGEVAPSSYGTTPNPKQEAIKGVKEAISTTSRLPVVQDVVGAAKAGLKSTFVDAPMKFSETVTGYKGGLTGVPGAPGAVPEKLSPGERGQKFGESLIDASTGTMGTVFSPAAALESVPVVGEPITKAFGALQEGGGKIVSEPVKFIAKDVFGIELTPEQEQYIEMGGETVAGAYMLKMARDAMKVRQANEYGVKVQESLKKGDFVAAREALTLYEQAVKTPPSTAGVIGSTLEAPISAGISKSFELAKSSLSKGIDGLQGLKTKVKPDVVTKRSTEIQAVIDQNKPLRTYVEKQNKKGVDVKNEVANTDLLRGAVDKDGVIRTKQEGGAVSQYRDFLKPQEKVVSDILKAEGKTMALKDVEANLTKLVLDSGLEGKALVKALSDIKSEIEGYSLRADSAGNIPVSLINDAKINKYATINYLSDNGVIDKTIARGLKEIVERETKSANVKALNAELAKHYSTIGFLEKLDGVRVKGGRLGKYFAQTIGTVVGSQFGPVGAVLGAELGGRIKGTSMSKTFGKEAGTPLKASTAMEEALAQSSKSEGSLKASQANTNIVTKIPIDKTIPKSTKKVNKPFKQAETPQTSKTIGKGTKIPVDEFNRLVKDFEPLYKKAPSAKKFIDDVAKDAADLYGGKVASTGLKSLERAIEKAYIEKNGQALAVTDIARNTIVAMDEVSMSNITKELAKNKNVINIKYKDVGSDVLGFKANLAKVKTPDGMIAEIQINTPDMVYAKEIAKDAKAILGEALYNETKKKVGFEGGEGHVFYEYWRSDNIKDVFSIEQNSNGYYNVVRDSYSGKLLDFSYDTAFTKFRSPNADYMIVSAENPMGKASSKMSNSASTRAFKAFMDKKKIEYKSQTGRYNGNNERSFIVRVDNPSQRGIIDSWLEKNSPQAENIMIKDGKAYRYDPRTMEAYEADLTTYNMPIELPASTKDFYSRVDGKTYKLPLYNTAYESSSVNFSNIYKK